MPSLIRKGYHVKSGNKDKFVLLGSGTPLRQFCYTYDLCELILWVLLRKDPIELIALVPEQEYTIRELGETIAKIYGI